MRNLTVAYKLSVQPNIDTTVLALKMQLITFAFLHSIIKFLRICSHGILLRHIGRIENKRIRGRRILNLICPMHLPD